MPKKDQKDSVRVAKLNRWFDAAESARKELDWKWFKYDLFVSGNHYARYDKNTKQIVDLTPTGMPRVVINKIYTTLRAVRNYALRNRPRAEVTPLNLKPEFLYQTVVLNQYLHFLHEKLGLRDLLKGTVWDSLKYSVGWWQILWDEDGKEIEVNSVDPYDLYIDPSAQSEKDAKFMVLAVRRNLDDLRNDPKYKEYKKELDDASGDARLAQSALKERLIKLEGMDGTLQEKDGSKIVKEFWYKEYDKDGTAKVLVTTLLDNKIIRHEETDLTRLPFFRLKSDVKPRSLYGEGWVKNMIPAQRELNRVVSHIVEYNHIMNKGKWVIDRGAGVRMVNNENGQIIEKKRGYDVKQETIVPLSDAAFVLEQSMNRYIEDIGAVHEATMGRIPTGARSGKAIESLQVGDSNNMSEVIENIEIFLEEVYEYMLSLAAKKYQHTRSIVPLTETGQRQFFTIIGEKAQNKPEGATVIPSQNMVDVSITSYLAHTSEARQEKALKLFELGVIDEQTVLEFFNVGSVADIMLRLQNRKEEERLRELQQNQDQQLINSTLQATPKSGQMQAIAAIRSLISGQAPQMPDAVNESFVGYIDEFLQSPEAQELDPSVLQTIQKYRDDVVQAAL